MVAKASTPKARAPRSTGRTAQFQRERQGFRSLLATNPNYFGNLALSPLKPVKEIISNTYYEEATSLGYHPARRQLFATFDVKRTSGYGGDLCQLGSTEYVRFYVNYGAGWQDVGVAASEVHDVAAGRDCERKTIHPLSYSVEVPFAPRRSWCRFPRLPQVRAILAWNQEPPAGEPEWKPPFGNVLECHVQIDKSHWPYDIFDGLIKAVDLPTEVVEALQELIEPPELDTDPPFPPDPPTIAQSAVLAVNELAALYAQPATSKRQQKPQFTVEPQRFAFAEYQAIKLSTDGAPLLQASLQNSLEAAGVAIADLGDSIEDTSGDISYEELDDLGFDWNQNRLVATYRVKKQTGFSGNLCTAGSTEYVSFWADFGDDCRWTYLDTVKVNAYDFEKLPDGGLCYSVALPVDLAEFQRWCSDPRIGRIRAVLSWNSPPSTNDPDALPHWGNRLDAHVLLPPRPRGQEQGLLTVVGGIAVTYINNASGLTTPSAKFVDNGLPADGAGRPCPFGARVVVRGASQAGRYRIRVVNLDTGNSHWLTSSILVTTTGGISSSHAPDDSVNGWFKYLSFDENIAGILGYFESTGDDRWRITLEQESGFGTQSQVVQLDNTAPHVEVSITDPVGDCGLVGPGTLLKGKVTATDLYMAGWSVVIDGGPAGFGPEPATTGGAGSNSTPASGSEWTYRIPAKMAQCGYVVRVHAQDLAILNSIGSHHHASRDVGFCVLTS